MDYNSQTITSIGNTDSSETYENIGQLRASLDDNRSHDLHVTAPDIMDTLARLGKTSNCIRMLTIPHDVILSGFKKLFYQFRFIFTV